MNAILVSVDFSDLLALTLPYNRHHFDDVAVVTSRADYDNVLPIAGANNAWTYSTDAFYRDGATFNKWAALEEGLDYMGRTGWICLMDVDILWPRIVDKSTLEVGNLYTPHRRIWANPSATIPDEALWTDYPVTQRHEEFAGYTQIFHGSDPHLGPAPWHELDWRHAGGADSFFQAKWPAARKVRPPFEVLHLGQPGQDWCGRVSRRVDGSVPEGAEDRREELRSYLKGRAGKRGPGRFDHERL
jgi:hypothetical protein